MKPRAGFSSRLPLKNKAVLKVAVVALAIMAAGCESPLVVIGERPRTENLASLVLGQSTPEEVRSALGTPRGQGKARLTSQEPLRDVWSYEFLQAQGDRVAIDMMLVMFKKNRYDGYWWFTSKETVKKPGPSK